MKIDELTPKQQRQFQQKQQTQVDSLEMLMEQRRTINNMQAFIEEVGEACCAKDGEPVVPVVAESAKITRFISAKLGCEPTLEAVQKAFKADLKGN